MLNRLRGMMSGRTESTGPVPDGGPGSARAGRPNEDSEHLLDRWRFGPERTMLADLVERFGLEDLINHMVDSGEAAPLHQALLAQQVRLTPLIAPRLFSLFGRVCERLSFSEPTDLYVFPSDRINAMALHRLGEDQPHAVSLTSEAVREMTDDELCFVLGHEVGHLHFRHYRLMMLSHMLNRSDEEDGQSQTRQRIPQLLERRLGTWSRLSELSVDRIGYLAAGESIEIALACFYKMASGLGPEHLMFDSQAFLAQLEQLERMPRKEVLSQFSHPVTPVRARALQLFATVAHSDDLERAAEVDAEVSRLTGLMEFEASTELGVQSRQFLLSAGLLAGLADGELSEDERGALVQLLLQVTGDPEGQLAAITSVAQAEQMLTQACDWLKENSGQERFALFGQVSNIVAIDGNLTPQERAFMMSVAVKLAIPEKAAREILHEVLSRYVRTKTAAGKWGLAFGAGEGDVSS